MPICPWTLQPFDVSQHGSNFTHIQRRGGNEYAVICLVASAKWKGSELK